MKTKIKPTITKKVKNQQNTKVRGNWTIGVVNVFYGSIYSRRTTKLDVIRVDSYVDIVLYFCMLDMLNKKISKVTYDVFNVSCLLISCIIPVSTI